MHAKHAWTTETYASAGVAVMPRASFPTRPGGRRRPAAPRDDEALDLRRPLVDLRDLRVAVVALGREARRVAVAAEDLDRLAGHPPRDAGGEELGLRALDLVRRARLLRRAARQTSALAASTSVPCRRSSAGSRRARRSARRTSGAPSRRRPRRRAPPARSRAPAPRSRSARCPASPRAMPSPRPGSPSRSAGVSSKVRSAVEEECSPILSSSRAIAMPCGAAAREVGRDPVVGVAGEDEDAVRVRRRS